MNATADRSTGDFDPDDALHALLFTAEGGADPYPTYDRLRAESPVHRSRYGPVWALTRYDDVYTALRDTRFGKGPVNFRELFSPRAEAYEALPPLVSDGSIVFMDPPEHTRVRGFVNRAFTPRRVEALRPYVTEMTDGLLDAMAERGGGDIVHDLAFAIPIDVIGELVGVPRDERDEVRALVAEAIAVFDPLAGNDLAGEGAAAARRLGGYFSALVRRVRRGDPSVAGDHLTRALVDQQARVGADERLRPTELVATLTLLFGAGFESTAYLISTGLATLLDRPEVVERLRADPAGWPGATEEALRYESVFQVTMRQVRAPVELGGRTLEVGDWVVPFLGAANHDPAVFAEPHRFRPDRQPNHHVAFSSGVHHCLGAALARLEIAVAFQQLFDRFDVTVDDRGPAPVWRSFPFRQLDRLPVRMAPRGG